MRCMIDVEPCERSRGSIVEALAAACANRPRRTTPRVSYRLGATRNDATPMSSATPSGPLTVDYLNGPDVAALALTDDEILPRSRRGSRHRGAAKR